MPNESRSTRLSESALEMVKVSSVQSKKKPPTVNSLQEICMWSSGSIACVEEGEVKCGIAFVIYRNSEYAYLDKVWRERKKEKNAHTENPSLAVSSAVIGWIIRGREGLTGSIR